MTQFDDDRMEYIDNVIRKNQPFEVEDTHVETTVDGNVIVIRLLDRHIDEARIGAIRQEVMRVLDSESARSVIVDLSAVEYLSSAGLGTLIDVKRHVDKKGAVMALVGVQTQLREVFRIFKLDQLFRMYDSVEDATR